jgi:hypothetical protein
MTILVSSVSPSIIVMLSDSAVTVTHYQEEGGSFNEYETGSKYYVFPGVGCITTWGDRTYNRLGQYLFKQQISKKTHSIKDVARLVYKYISEEYTKNDELGFHIGGFDKNGKACLFHVFWGFDIPTPPEQTEPTSHIYDHSNWVFLYNGRNDLANIVLSTLKEQIDNNQDVRFDLKTPSGRISLCDFIARFASEITPQVSPPFVINLIFPDNSIEKVENTSYNPISLQSIASVIPRLSPVSNFPSANENVVLEAQPIQPSGWGTTGTSSIEPPNEDTQGGTIIYIHPRNKDG